MCIRDSICRLNLLLRDRCILQETLENIMVSRRLFPLFSFLFTLFYCCLLYTSILTVRYFQGSITYFSCFLAKDGTEQTLLCGQLGFSLRSYFSDQNITGTYLCTCLLYTSFRHER